MDDRMTTTRTVSTTTEIVLTGKDIIAALRGDLSYQIPEAAEVSFDVPGGGDWSNTRLEIDDDTPVTIRWTVTTRETS